MVTPWGLLDSCCCWSLYVVQGPKMKVEFVTDFEARTATGVQLIKSGRAMDLAPDKASKLIAANVARAVYDVPPSNPESVPYIDTKGRLIIPFDCPEKYRYWAGGQPVRETLQEVFEERKSIMMFDGGLTREEAEEEASRITSRYVSDYIQRKGG